MIEGIVILGYGPQNIEFFAKASEMCGEGSVIDPDVARKAGASFAVGAPDAIADLSKRLSAGALNHAKAEHVDAQLSDAAIEWLANGERGVSSNTIFTTITGSNAIGRWAKDHPSDPADLIRCFLLLDACPEFKPQLGKMRDVSPEWAALVDHWDELRATLDEEAPEWLSRKGRAPKTYAKMKDLFKQANN